MSLQAKLAKFQSQQGALQQEMVELVENRQKARAPQLEPPAQQQQQQLAGAKRSRSAASGGGAAHSEDNSQSLTTAEQQQGGGAASSIRLKMKGSMFKVKAPKGAVIARRAEPPVRGKVLKDAREFLRGQEQPVPAAQLERALNLSFEAYPEMRAALLAAEFVEHSPGADTFRFKFDERVVDKGSLLRFLRAQPFGRTLRHVKDLYPAVLADLQELRAEGRLLLLAALEEEQQVVYPLADAADGEREKQGLGGFDPFLAAEYLATELPRDTEALSRAYQEAFRAKGKAATTVFERVAEIKPERQRARKARAWQMDKVTNAHMPELFAGARATQIDSANY